MATLLDDAQSVYSERTMCRILAAQGASGERRPQLRHPAYQRPELVATAPNRVWSCDIRKRLGPRK